MFSNFISKINLFIKKNNMLRIMVETVRLHNLVRTFDACICDFNQTLFVKKSEQPRMLAFIAEHYQSINFYNWVIYISDLI